MFRLALITIGIACTCLAEPSLSIKDTAAYRNDIYEGRLGRLYAGGTFVDSIDLGFGIGFVGRDSALYVKVETFDKEYLKGTYFTKLMFLHNGAKAPLSDSLPFYNEHFSSPAVIDSVLFYWGFYEGEPLAAKFDFRTHRTDTIGLHFEGAMIADSPSHFLRPAVQPGGILYALQTGQGYLVTRGLKIVRQVKQKAGASSSRLNPKQGQKGPSPRRP